MNRLYTQHEMMELITDAAMLGALASNAIHGYASDDISERQAIATYGRAWLNDRTRRGLLHYTRCTAAQKSGKRYSRFEIEALKVSEKNIKNLTRKFVEQYGN